MKKTVAALMIVFMLFPAFTAYAGEVQTAPVSADSSTLLGDVDGSGEVDIADALYLQFYMAKLWSLSSSGQLRSDVDLNDKVDSADITYIQRWLAHIDIPYTLSADVNRVRETYRQKQYEESILNQINGFTRSKGVDISEHNGSVDMNKLKAAGYSFVIIRLGYGGDYTDQDDSRFAENVRKAEAAGLDWGAYIYSYALNVNSAKSEVNHTLRLLKGKKPTMPVVFDWETDDYKERNGMPSNANVLKIANTYLSGIKNAGYYPMIYTGYYWLKGAFNNKAFLDSYDIWYAQWSTSYDYHDRPIGIWQYGGETNYLESPYITGLSGAFDKNYSYKNYPMIIKAYGYNNHDALLKSYAATGAELEDESEEYEEECEPLPPECDGVMGDSLRDSGTDDLFAFE